MKKSLLLALLFLTTNVSLADQVIQGVHETTSYVQEIGLAICALGGVIGGVMMAFNQESGAQWISKALLGTAAIGAVTILVSSIGGFFGIG